MTGADRDAWRSLSHAELALEVLKKFAIDIPEGDLQEMMEKTSTAEIYCNARLRW